MTLNIISAEEALRQIDSFDTVIDARSEDEYAEDHLPGAVNWPTLNNAERISIGTMYKQVNAFEAKKRGAALAARNIAAHIEREVIEKPKNWRPLAYCWRGGNRSGSLALILDKIGFRVTLIEGGYKAFRAAMVANTANAASQLSFRVVCGTTGSGKTRLLHALKQVGAQVLDLEALASHRSSVLGAIPGVQQPSQKRFDTLVWDELRHFDASRPVYVESESKKVGNLYVPPKLIEKMRSSPCIDLEMPLDSRVALLLEDYAYLTENPEYFCGRLDVLTELRGKEVIAAWKAKARSGDFASVVRDLLSQHYDPVYLQSMQRNFSAYESAMKLRPFDHTPSALLDIARQLHPEN